MSLVGGFISGTLRLWLMIYFLAVLCNSEVIKHTQESVQVLKRTFSLELDFVLSEGGIRLKCTCSVMSFLLRPNGLRNIIYTNLTCAPNLERDLHLNIYIVIFSCQLLYVYVLIPDLFNRVSQKSRSCLQFLTQAQSLPKPLPYLLTVIYIFLYIVNMQCVSLRWK